jgi:hypothetical protein
LNYIKIYKKINLKKEKKLKIKIIFLKNTIYIYIYINRVQLQGRRKNSGRRKARNEPNNGSLQR